MTTDKEMQKILDELNNGLDKFKKNITAQVLKIEAQKAKMKKKGKNEKD